MPGTVESALSEPVQWAELSEKNRLAEMNQSSFASLQRRLSRIRQSRASRSSVPLFLHPDWPVICLAIGRTGVSLSVHLYMVITGRFALVLLEVPLSQSHIERELRQLHSLQWNVFYYSNGGSWSLSKVPGSSSKHMQRHRDAAEQTVCDALLKG